MTITVKSLLKANSYGFIELLLAAYVILIPYGIGPIRFDFIMPIILMLVAQSKTHQRFYKGTLAFNVLILYAILHEVILCFVLLPDLPSYHVNSFISMVMNMIAIYFVVPSVDFKKLITAFMSISIIVIMGEIFHLMLIMTGKDVTPITIPFLPFNLEGTRLLELGNRPKSFFLEPSNLAQYYMFPLFFSLYYKKFLYAAVLVIAILTSSSTNGIVIVIVMLVAYVFTQKGSKVLKLCILFFLVLVGVLYMSLEIFSIGREKLETTEITNVSRTVNGPILVSEMPNKHLIVGFPSANHDDYIEKSGYVDSGHFSTLDSGEYYVSGFWEIIAKYGIVGLVLYFCAYYSIYKKNKFLFVLISPIFALLFSGTFSFGAGMFLWMVYIFSFIEYEQKNRALQIAVISKR